MSQLVNVTTKKPEALPDDQIADAILTGTHSYAAGSMVKMRDDQNRLVEIPAENVQRAVQMGFQPYGPREEAVDEYKDENKGIKGDLKVAAGQFVNQSLLGIPELVAEHKADPLEMAKWEGLQKDHDLANFAGGGAGVGASLLVGGPLFKGATKAGALTEAAIAAKLGAAAGEEVGKRTITGAAKQIAAKIAAKTAGGAVEGAIVAAPHALTEAALGDPKLGGEAVLWGGGLGALLGGTAGAAGELLGLTGKAAKKGYEWLGGRELTPGNLKTKLMEYGFSVPEEDIAAYMANRERIVAGESRSAINIMDDIDGAVGKYKSQEDAARQEWMDAADELNTHHKAKIFELRTERPSLDVAQSITDDLDEARSWLGQRSEDAESALEGAVFKIGKKEVPITWKRSTLLGDITKQINKLGAAVTPEVEATQNYLADLRGKLEANYGAELNGPEMRDLMRKIRKSNEAAFQRESGEFGDYLGNALMDISEGISSKIKTKLNKYGYTEYEDIMKEMSPVARSLRGMQKKFGTIEKSLSSIRGLAGGKNEDVLEKMLADYSALRGKNFMDSVKSYREAKNLLMRDRLEDLKPILLPNLHAAEQDARARYEALASRNEGIRSLTPGRTQGVVNNQMRMKPNEKIRRELEALSQLEGHTPGVDDYLTQIEDRRVLDSFDKSRIQGSRRVNWLGSLATAAAGGLVGGPVGAAIGATAGAVIDVDGGKILRRLLDGEGFLGPLFVEKQMKAGGAKLDRMKDVLGKMKDRATKGGSLTPAPVDAARMSAIRGMVDHLVDPEKRHDKQETHSTINDRLSDWVANPSRLTNDIQAVASNLGKTGAPIISGMASQNMVTAVQYLNTHMPKPPRMASPFAPKVKWKPSSYQLKAFEEKFEAIADPFSVIDHLENGTLTRNHMEAIKTVYPALHGIIQSRVYDAVSQGDLDLGYTDRLKLSLLMDMPLDQSMSQIARHQQTFAEDPTGTQTADNVGQQQPQGAGFKASVKLSSQYKTNKY